MTAKAIITFSDQGIEIGFENVEEILPRQLHRASSLIHRAMKQERSRLLLKRRQEEMEAAQVEEPKSTEELETEAAPNDELDDWDLDDLDEGGEDEAEDR